jgi:hypothetical protein
MTTIQYLMYKGLTLHAAGRSGSIAWPPGSPDLISHDFCMCGYVKNIVYAVTVRDLDHIRQRIAATVSAISLDMPHLTWTESVYGMDVCRFRNCVHINTY